MFGCYIRAKVNVANFVQFGAHRLHSVIPIAPCDIPCLYAEEVQVTLFILAFDFTDCGNVHPVLACTDHRRIQYS